jgi:hypothetical protein
MRCRQIHAVAAIGLLALAACGSCGRRAAPAPRDTPAATDAGAPAAPAVAAVEPRTLFSLPESAYHVTIAADDDGAYLLTRAGAYRLEPQATPRESRRILGLGATATRSSFIYWSHGAVFAAPKGEGEARRLIALADQPQLFVAAGETIAWLQRTQDGRFSLRARAGKKPVTVYASPGSIDAIAMQDDWLFFVERPAGSDWRIGRTRAGGGEATFTALRSGRAPAMLVAHRDIYFYDGNSLQVRRLSPDLQREQALVSGFVCSPIAVSAHVYCAQVEGIFELRAGEPPRRLVPGSAARMVTELAATPKRLLWVVDAGAEKLEVKELALGR